MICLPSTWSGLGLALRSPRKRDHLLLDHALGLKKRENGIKAEVRGNLNLFRRAGRGLGRKLKCEPHRLQQGFEFFADAVFVAWRAQRKPKTLPSTKVQPGRIVSSIRMEVAWPPAPGRT